LRRFDLSSIFLSQIYGGQTRTRDSSSKKCFRDTNQESGALASTLEQRASFRKSSRVSILANFQMYISLPKLNVPCNAVALNTLLPHSLVHNFTPLDTKQTHSSSSVLTSPSSSPDRHFAVHHSYIYSNHSAAYEENSIVFLGCFAHFLDQVPFKFRQVDTTIRECSPPYVK